MSFTQEKKREFEKYLLDSGLSPSTAAQYSAALKSVLRKESLEAAKSEVSLAVYFRMQRALDLYAQFNKDPTVFPPHRQRQRVSKADDAFFQYLVRDAGFTPTTAIQYSSHLRAILAAGDSAILMTDPNTFVQRAAVFVYARTNTSAYVQAWENFRALMQRKRKISLPGLTDVADGPEVSLDQHLALWVLWDVGYLTPQAISRLQRESLRFSPCRSQVDYPSPKGDQKGRGCVSWAFDAFMCQGAPTGPLTGLSPRRIKALCSSVHTVLDGDPLETAHKLTRTWSRRNRQSAARQEVKHGQA